MAGDRPQTHFPFGKHKGTAIDEVPEDYLVWALANMEELRPGTRAMIEGSLKRRRGSGAAASHGPSTQLTCPACGSMLGVSLHEVGARDTDGEVPF